MNEKDLSGLYAKDLDSLIKLFITAFHSLKDLLYVVEVKNGVCRYVFVNQAGLNILNTDESIYGKTFYDILEKEDAEFLKKQYEKVLACNRVVTFENQILLPDGEVMVNETVLTPFIDDNNTIYIIAVVRDITGKTKRLTEFQQSQSN